MLQHIITGIVNLFSFFSVETTTNDIQPFLAALFLFACSILLEAMALHNNLKRERSFIICFFMVFLYVGSVLGIIISFLGFSEYIQIQLADATNNSSKLIFSSTKKSLLHIPQYDMTPFFIAFGFIVTLIPLLLCVRLLCLQIVRKDYVLTSGFFGK